MRKWLDGVLTTTLGIVWLGTIFFGSLGALIFVVSWCMKLIGVI